MDIQNFAADDFEAINKRLAELAQDRIRAAGITADGNPIGPCSDCQERCISCTGMCSSYD